MNLDFALVNRALQNIGLDSLTHADKEDENAAWRTARDFYLATFLEAVAQVEWTSAKRRRELVPAQMPRKKNADFAYVYDLPLDCAKTIELDGHAYFEVESVFLFTDAAPARLLYVSNGKRLIDQGALAGGGARRQPTSDYFSGGNARRDSRYEWGDNIVTGGNAGRLRFRRNWTRTFPITASRAWSLTFTCIGNICFRPNTPSA